MTTPKTYIEEYECGIRVNSGDIQGCVNAILRIKDMDEDERTRMGERGHQATINHFNYRTLSKKFESVLGE